MNMYKISKTELEYLQEMVIYLNSSSEELSKHSTQRVNEVFMKISSRPVVDIIIDSSILGDLEESKDNE